MRDASTALLLMIMVALPLSLYSKPRGGGEATTEPKIWQLLIVLSLEVVVVMVIHEGGMAPRAEARPKVCHSVTNRGQGRVRG